MKQILFCLLAMILSGPFLQAQDSYTFYVDPVAGNDNNPGTSEQQAFKTLVQAAGMVRILDRRDGQDITVWLKDGSYFFDSTLTFLPEDGGSSDHRVIYRNMPGETPVFTSGKTVGQWNIHNRKKNIWSASVENEFRQLYIRGELRTMARHPNMDNDLTFGPYLGIRADTENRTFRIEPPGLPGKPDYRNMEITMITHYQFSIFRMDDWTKAAGDSIDITPSVPRPFNKNQRYYDQMCWGYLQNAYELLDAPGEWYLDRNTMTLYYIPLKDEDTDSLVATYPSTETFIRIKGTPGSPVRNLVFEGIVFTCSNWTHPSAGGVMFGPGCNPLRSGYAVPSVVSVFHAGNLSFHRNVFMNTGGTGLEFYKGVKHSEVKGNVFCSNMANCLIVDTDKKKNPSAEDQCEFINISNNYLNRSGRMYSISAAMVLKYVKNITIEHNELENHPYMGIGIGWFTGRRGNTWPNIYTGMSDNLVQYNFIHDVMQLHDDAAGIYTLGQQAGTLIRENYITGIFKSRWAGNSPVAGIYLDNQSEFIVVERNVIGRIEIHRRYHEQLGLGARNNIWIHNTDRDPEIQARAGLQDEYKSIKKINVTY